MLVKPVKAVKVGRKAVIGLKFKQKEDLLVSKVGKKAAEIP